jgi:hypothetical protein
MSTPINEFSSPMIGPLPAYILAVNYPDKLLERQNNIFITSNGTDGLCSTGVSLVLMGDQLSEDGIAIATNTTTGYVPYYPWEMTPLEMVLLLMVQVHWLK